VTRRAAKPLDLTLERDIQRDVIELYERLGCQVVRFSQVRLGSGTRQTPGIADLRIYCPRLQRAWWHETKTPTGKQSVAQALFQALVEQCGERYVLGGQEAAIEYTRNIGLLAGRV